MLQRARKLCSCSAIDSRVQCGAKDINDLKVTQNGTKSIDVTSNALATLM